MSVEEKILTFKHIFGWTTPNILEKMNTQLNIDFKVLDSLWYHLAEYENSKYIEKDTLKLINRLWKEYSGCYTHFGIGDSQHHLINIFNELNG